jgi:hypothetical protein
MRAYRHLCRHHWAVAMAIVMMAMLARIAVPTGYMPMAENGHVAMMLCGEQNPGMAGLSAMLRLTQVIEVHADRDYSGGDHTPGHDTNGSCGFGGLSLASLAAADPVLLALALLFIVATTFRRPQPSRIATARFLWPPRTGPPLDA